jgi:hypothetical protein
MERLTDNPIPIPLRITNQKFSNRTPKEQLSAAAGTQVYECNSYF